MNNMKVAVLVPCYNEEVAITQVVKDFKRYLPEATVYIYDNNSKDKTKEKAAAAGAVVRTEPLQGKGNVVRRMFADIDADVYVLVDGDDTYDAKSAPAMINRLVEENLDMVVGSRLQSTMEDAAFRHGHRFGNVLLTSAVSMLFGNRFTDMLSGYRIFSRRFVKSFPALAKGFEIETELTVHALQLSMPICEMQTPYKARPEGSVSKLRTYHDGFRILMTIMVLFKEELPLFFFGLAGGVLALLSIALGIPIVKTYLETGLVPRFPTAILSTGLMILAFLSFTSGLILETVTKGRLEIKRLFYLSKNAPNC